MNQNLSIIFGFFMLFLAFFVITWVFTALYFKIAKERISEVRDIEVSIWLTIVGFSALLFSLVFISSYGVPVYIFSSFVLMVVPMAVILGKYWKFQISDTLILAVSLSVLLNPFWLTLLGVK